MIKRLYSWKQVNVFMQLIFYTDLKDYNIVNVQNYLDIILVTCRVYGNNGHHTGFDVIADWINYIASHTTD